MMIQSIFYDEAFMDAYAEVSSETAKQALRRTIQALLAFPDMGTAHPRRTLLERYGNDIRTMPSGAYVIVYRHEDSRLFLLALVPGKLVL